MSFSIKPAQLKDKPLIHALLQPYLDELSRFPDEHPDYKDANGVYLYPYLDAYWQEKERFPYLLYKDKVMAGFALVRKNGDHWEMAEFYVKSPFRGRGLAEACGAEIIRQHPGKWFIEFNRYNTPSRNLWKKLGGRLADDKITEGKADGSHDFVKFTVNGSRELFEYYNERAPEYEAFYAGEFPTGPRSPELYKNDTAAIQKMLPHYVKGNCIDIACGTGFWLPYYYKGCSGITLIDQADGVLKECDKKIQHLGITGKVQSVRGDVFKDVPANNSYNCAVAGFLISHFNDEEMGKFFSVVKQAIAKDGLFIIIDSVWGKEAKTHQRDKQGTTARRLFDGREFQIYKRYFTKDDLKDISAVNNFKLDIIYWGKVFFLCAGSFSSFKRPGSTPSP